MRSLVLAVLLTQVTLLSQERISAKNAGPTLSREAMEADLDELAAAIREKWSYLEDRSKNFGVDLDALVNAAKKKLPETGSRSDFHAIVLELVAGLKDGHASVITPGFRDGLTESGAPFVSPPLRRWSFCVEQTADGLAVVGERSPEGWLNAGESYSVALGQRVVAVDGVPIEKRLAEIERTTMGSTDGGRRKRALNRLHWTDATNVTVASVGRDPPTSVREVPVLARRPPEPPKYVDCGPWRYFPWSRNRLESGVVGVSAGAFEDESKEEAEARLALRDLAGRPPSGLDAYIDGCFRELRSSRTQRLVLDLRGTSGSSDRLAICVARHLLPKPFLYSFVSEKAGGTWNPPRGVEHQPFPPEQRYDGPLAILIDEECCFAADNFLRSIIENRNDVITVGRPTGGSTGLPAIIVKMPRSETAVTLCVSRVYGPKGGLIEGRGTTPTIPVKWTAADYLEKRDPDLAAAVEALKKAESRTAGR